LLKFDSKVLAKNLRNLGVRKGKDVLKLTLEQAAARKGTVTMLACYEEIMKEKRSLSRQTSLLNFVHQRRFLWTMVTVIQMTCLQFQRKCLLLKLSFVLSDPEFFFNFS